LLLTGEDKNVISHDDSSIHLSYESTVIEDVLRFFLPLLQDILQKMESTLEINEEEFRYLTLLDDMVMIYTFEATFRSRPLSKINDTLDIQ
jgi:hypothetical protein